MFWEDVLEFAEGMQYLGAATVTGSESGNYSTVTFRGTVKITFFILQNYLLCN
jgi:hypothetical protein